MLTSYLLPLFLCTHLEKSQTFIKVNTLRILCPYSWLLKYLVKNTHHSNASHLNVWHNFKWMIRATWWSKDISVVHPFSQCPRQLSPSSLLTPPIPPPSFLSASGLSSCFSESRSHQKRLHACTITYTCLLVSELINSITLCIAVEELSALKSKTISSSTCALDFLSSPYSRTSFQ